MSTGGAYPNGHLAPPLRENVGLLCRGRRPRRPVGPTHAHVGGAIRLSPLRGNVGLRRRGRRPRQPVCRTQARVGQGGRRIAAPARGADTPLPSSACRETADDTSTGGGGKSPFFGLYPCPRTSNARPYGDGNAGRRGRRPLRGRGTDCRTVAPTSGRRTRDGRAMLSPTVRNDRGGKMNSFIPPRFRLLQS